MHVLFIILPLAIGMAGVALAAFMWAVRRGQFDDLDTPQVRAIFDDPGDPSRPLGRSERHAESDLIKSG
jgi:cbb3-type cytochrome oxidase maturation protein